MLKQPRESKYYYYESYTDKTHFIMFLLLNLTILITLTGGISSQVNRFKELEVQKHYNNTVGLCNEYFKSAKDR